MNETQCSKLKVIKQNHPHDVGLCCTEMFEYWLVVDTEASWSKLIEKLNDIQLNAVAERIKTNILKGLYVNLCKLCMCVHV